MPWRLKACGPGYDRITALEDVSFQLAEQQVLGIIGPNGSGKSTLMKAVLGLVKPWRGQITVLGQPAEQQRRQVGYVPQIEQVDWDFPVSVADVALMGRYARRGLLRRTNKEDRELAGAALEKVGMYPLRPAADRRTIRRAATPGVIGPGLGQRPPAALDG